ncbi:unnamed protein product [Candidula unifasciata]|uniref:SERTA domain-containing protein n=1 Tax=Candidula unifasciata TaxID=100452 RepID=A0A8S3YHS0_9EUPU|nr:unnamed protein product [Candidula unifasciata]
MPPMATSSAKRKWSDVFEETEVYDKQSIMDLCASKLRYVNPPRPPRRRTEVSLLRNVLIVNTVKHLSSDTRTDSQMELSTEDLSIDPGHFEGLPPLSELLNDIMLDPQPNDPASSFTWTAVDGCPVQTPQGSDMSPYMETADEAAGISENKVVYDLLPSTCGIEADASHQSQQWGIPNSHSQDNFSWELPCTSDQQSSWESPCDSSMLDCLLSSASIHQPSNDSLDVLMTDRAFQPTNGPLPSISSLFESSRKTSLPGLLESSSLPGVSSFSSGTQPSHTPAVSTTQTDDLLGNVNLTDSELELLAMTFSSKLPASFEDLVLALPQTALLQQVSQPSHTFCMPSSVQSTIGVYNDTHSSSSNQCASFCQPAPSLDDSGMVRVLVNL